MGLYDFRVPSPRPIAVVAAALAAGCLCAPDTPSAVLELPAHPAVEHQDAGPGAPGATCASGDGCAACELLDADCQDGATCGEDGLCTSGCFEPDPDCRPAPDGLHCGAGEECESGTCTFVDGDTLCTRPCDASGACPDGFSCVSPADHAPLCLPSRC